MCSLSLFVCLFIHVFTSLLIFALIFIRFYTCIHCSRLSTRSQKQLPSNGDVQPLQKDPHLGGAERWKIKCGWQIPQKWLWFYGDEWRELPSGKLSQFAMENQWESPFLMGTSSNSMGDVPNTPGANAVRAIRKTQRPRKTHCFPRIFLAQTVDFPHPCEFLRAS